MPEKATIAPARKDAREGKSPSTQAGEFVREEIHHVREGKHGARSTKQAIAIGLSKARRAGVKLPKPRRGTAMLCVNPLSGTTAPALASASLGMAKRDEKTGAQSIIRPGVGARCDDAPHGRGLLLIDGMPDLGPYVLPGNNYHVYDYALFWTNVRADAARRLDAFWAR